MMKSTKIYFVCPKNKFASGGVKQIYRQVEILQKNGYQAFVLHKKKTKEKWFQSSAVIKSSPFLFKLLKYFLSGKKLSFSKKIKLSLLKRQSETIGKNDILVFPEIYGNAIYSVEPEVRKIIFNQNCYYTFNTSSINRNNTCAQESIQTIITVSEDSKNYLEYAFPKSEIHRIRLGINHHIFNYSDKKEKQICFMPRKLSEDVTQVINILRQRAASKGWKLVSIDNKSEKEVAEIMKQSLIFLSFNHREGFGLPPAEAMACGCFVIGYQGQGSKEYLKAEFSYPIAEGDIISFTKNIERLMHKYESDPQSILEKGKMASDFILETYSLKNEEADILKIWEKILQ